jgi:4-hydroxybutyryl-CoA dehydratase/vinylacetyl-CoA-Delta-isomerase
MTLKTKQEYIYSLKQLNKKIFCFGEQITDYVDHPMVRPSINALAMTYDLSHDPQYQELMTRKSNLTGEQINRFTHLFQDSDDLVNKIKMQRLLGQLTGCCFQRCVGLDSINAIDIVTFRMDQSLGTEYNTKFRQYLSWVQHEDLVIDGAMTDPKGDRKLSPAEQADPDLYLHLIKKDPHGIVIRGAKIHQTGAINSHHIIIMPTRSLRENEKEYAVVCAVPADEEGITYVLGRQSSDTRRMEGGQVDVGNFVYGGHEAVVIFDDVFVPWERVFMCGEFQYASQLVEVFAGYHRVSYGGCKPGMGDVLIGAASSVAKYHGTDQASHIKDKLVEMIHLNESMYAGGIAASSEGIETESGTYLIDQTLANVCKLNVTRFPYEIARLAQDIAGGLLVTLPSEKDFNQSEIGPLLKKYLVGKQDYPTENRQRLLRLIENLTMGAGSVAYLAESMHGAGSPMAQRIMLRRLANLEQKENLAK